MEMLVTNNDEMSTLKYYALALITIIFWASAFVGIRYGIEEYHPGSLALLRYLVASACMLIVYPLIPNKTRLSKKEIGIAILCGILGIALYNITLNYGEIILPAAIASFTIAQSPVLTCLLAMIFLKERLRPIGYIGMAISFVGVCIIALIAQGADPSTVNSISLHNGLMLVIAAVFCMSLYSVLQKPLLHRVNPLQFVCYAIWAGTAVLLIYSKQMITDVQHAHLAITFTIVYMGVVPGCIAYLLWSYMLSKTQVTRVCCLLYIIPIATIFLGWIFLKEMPQPLALAGGFVALIGAYLVSRCVK